MSILYAQRIDRGIDRFLSSAYSRSNHCFSRPRDKKYDDRSAATRTPFFTFCYEVIADRFGSLQFSKSGCSGSLLYRSSPFTISSTRNINTIIIKRPMYHRDFNNSTKTRHDDNNKSGHRGKERVIIKESR